MTQLGVFKDDYYNSVSVLTNSQVTLLTGALSATILTAAQLAGAGDVYINVSGQTAAQTATTDTAANIIAQLQNAIQAANIAAGNPLGVQPAGVPNLTNLSYTLSIVNANTSSGALTLTAGTGVTHTGSLVIPVQAATAQATAVFVVTVTSPTTINLARAQ